MEKANSIVEKEQYDIVVYNFCEIDENGHVFGTYNFCEDETGSVSMQDIRKHMRFTIVVPGRIYNRQFWRETGAEFPKRLWYEDTAIASYVFSRCKKMYLLNETLYYYIQREGSTMNNQKLEKMMDIMKSLNYLHSLFIRTDSFDEYKNEIEATSATGIIVIINRLNMLEKGDRLQTQLSDYLFDRFPNCFENSLLDDEVLKKLTLVKEKKFKGYYLRYSLKPVLKTRIKKLIPKGIVSFYRKRKYSCEV